MILNRLVLRLAAVSAISNFQEEPYPTLAGPHIFDSRIEPIENTTGNVAYPLCVIYTDYDKDAPTNGATASRDRIVTLTFELLCAVITKEDDLNFRVEYPVTDSELELSLDIFEAQIFRALQADNLAAETFRYLVYAYHNTISRRGATVEGGQKLAARQVTLEVKCLRDPLDGTMPPKIAEFLDELDRRGEFGDRVAAIREVYPSATAPTDGVAIARAFGYSNAVSDALGVSVDTVSVLPAAVTWLDPNGNMLS